MDGWMDGCSATAGVLSHYPAVDERIKADGVGGGIVIALAIVIDIICISTGVEFHLRSCTSIVFTLWLR